MAQIRCLSILFIEDTDIVLGNRPCVHSLQRLFFIYEVAFFLQRKFPHEAVLPSLDAARQLFKKHCNQVGSFTRSFLSLECPYMNYLFAFCTSVL